MLPNTMKSLRWHGPEKIQLDEVIVPRPKKGEVVVKIGAATTCGTDFKTFKRGHPRLIKAIPAPFGHEMAGNIIATGNQVKNFKVGDRVAIGNSAPCDQCFYCKRSQWSLCEDLLFLNGAYAEYLLIPARIVAKNLYLIPESLNFSTAALAEPLACVLHAWKRLEVQSGQTIALLGAGPMGVLFVQLAKLSQVKLVAIARDPEKLGNLKNLGANEVVSLTHDANPVEKCKDLLNQGRGADRVIEAVGLPETWELAMELARPGAKVCFYGGCIKGSHVKVDTYRTHYEELNLFGVFHHTPEYFQEAVKLLASKKILPHGLVVGHYPLTEFHQIFQPGQSSNPLKYALIP